MAREIKGKSEREVRRHKKTGQDRRGQGEERTDKEGRRGANGRWQCHTQLDHR